MITATHDRNYAAVGTLFFHAGIIIALIFGMRSCNLQEGGGGGGNNGMGDGLTSVDVAGIGNFEEGWGDPVPEPQTAEAAEAVTENTPDLSQSESDVSVNTPDKPQNNNPKPDNPKNTNQQNTQQTQQTNNQLNNAFSHLGSGNSSGNTQQGNPNGQIGGKGVVNGNGGSPGSGGGTGGGINGGDGPGIGKGKGIGMGELAGRSYVKKPNLTDSFNDEGYVVLDIMVDSQGNVISAVPNAKDSNTNSARLYELAVKAAKQAKFNVVSSAGNQRGKITITFRLK